MKNETLSVLSLGEVKYLKLESETSIFSTGGFFVLKANLGTIRTFFNDDNIIKMFGLWQFDSFSKSMVAAKQQEYEVIPPNGVSETVVLSAADLNSRLFLCFMSLWFIKDNSITNISMFARSADGKFLGTNQRQDIVTLANGKAEITTFSNIELNQSMPIYDRIFQLYSEYGASGVGINEKINFEFNTNISFLNNVKYDNKISRIVKALEFLRRARTNSFLPAKISFYIVILESLFTTGHFDVKRNVSTRSAFYISNEEQTVCANYGIVFKSYKIRSQFLHGLSLEGSQASVDRLIEISVELDGIVRKVLNKAIYDEDHFSLSQKDREVWFESFVLYNLKSVDGKIIPDRKKNPS